MAHGERRRRILSTIATFFRRSQLKDEPPVARTNDVRKAARKVIRTYRKDLEEMAKY